MPWVAPGIFQNPRSHRPDRSTLSARRSSDYRITRGSRQDLGVIL